MSSRETTAQTGQVIQGEALAELQKLPDGIATAVITDPPYSSGGAFRGDRMADPTAKYCQNGEAVGRISFTGDNRDGRSWAYWCAMWMSEAQRVTKPGGYLLCFTDWRMLPLCTDAVQAGGWLWRGLIAWDKGPSARAPHKGYFRHQCEYIVWCSNGPLPVAEHDGPYDGCLQVPVRQDDKHHMTGKPTELMRRLVRIVPDGGLVLDPFAGSGTTLVAAAERGLPFIGIEREAENVAIARNRIATTAPYVQRGVLAATGGLF